MNDAELKSTFPFGARLIPYVEDAPATRVVVGQSWEDEDYPDYFHVWRDPQRDVLLSRDLVPERDGFDTTNGAGEKYFLRPLTKDQEFKF